MDTVRLSKRDQASAPHARRDADRERRPSERLGARRGRAAAQRRTSRPRPRTRAKTAPRTPVAKPRKIPKAAAPRPRRHAGRLVALGALLVLVILAVVGRRRVRGHGATELPDPTKQLHGTRPDVTHPAIATGSLITELFAEQNRTNVPLGEHAAGPAQAVIATEDQRFYEHAGVDPLGIARALWIDVTHGREAQGGSTITQQYVKNAFIDRERTLKRKIKEAMLAYQAREAVRARTRSSRCT